MYKNKIFEKNVIQAWPHNGLSWLKSLPETVGLAKQCWDLKDITEFSDLSYNYVAHAYKDTIAVVLKLGCDEHTIQKEIIALQTYNGNGSIRLLDYNMQYKALLLERAIPGGSCKSLYPANDDEAVLIAVEVIKKLHNSIVPENTNIPSLYDLFIEIYESKIKLDSYHINKARVTLDYLLSTQTKLVLLHGDLHHDNILLSERDWLAIDPHGLIGDQAYEVCSFIRNPNPNILKSKELIKHRLDLFSKYLEIDRERLYKWIYVRAVLEACWAIADGEKDVEIAFAEAYLIDSIR